LEPYLQGVKRLYYSTEGLANFIPFYALSCGKGLFLSDRFELIQLLNIRDILNQQAISRLDSIALFGGIDFGAGETKPEVSHKPKSNLSSVEAIPGATTEIERIAKLFRETGAQAKEHCELDKETLSTSCMSQPGCIHVLSHGFFFNDPKLAYDLVPVPEYIASDIKTHTNPLLRSGLIASNYNILLQSSDIKPGDTGVITSHDIAALNLKETGLVTIHACETALGAVRNGETYGLILAFKMAGVKFVILTLWKIMHTDFFILFYQYLLEDPDKEVRKAFTRAVVTLRQKHPNPFYWGGFILVE
jgi:CHAT domain-containing protein